MKKNSVYYCQFSLSIHNKKVEASMSEEAAQDRTVKHNCVYSVWEATDIYSVELLLQGISAGRFFGVRLLGSRSWNTTDHKSGQPRTVFHYEVKLSIHGKESILTKESH